MRVTRLLTIAACLVFVTCDSIDNFQVDQRGTATIPGASIVEQLAGDIGFPQFASFDLTQDQNLKNQGVTKDQIDSVKISILQLAVMAPADQDFDFLTSIKFFVESPGMPKVMIASGGPFPAGSRTVDLELEDVELKPYAVSSAMKITTDATGRRPRQQTTVEAGIVLDVDVNVGGAICGG